LITATDERFGVAYPIFRNADEPADTICDRGGTVRGSTSVTVRTQ
jgi:hypothetical protein